MKTQGMKHQIDALRASSGKRNYAYLMEQGCGKTWTTLADAERCFMENKVDCLIVVAPKGVHTNWVRREIPTHLSVPCLAVAWRGRPTTKAKKADIESLFQPFPEDASPKLRVFTINIDALIRDEGYEVIEDLLSSFRCMMVVDESQRIKNHKAQRTKRCIKLGRKAVARRILTGSPLTKGPPDLYAQFDFLQPGLLGTTSYRAFFAEFAILLEPDDPKMIAIMRKNGGRYVQTVATDEKGNKQWKNLDKLRRLIQPHSYRVTKKECLDLPPKIYKQLTFELSPAQRKVYDRLKHDYAYLTDNMEDKSFVAIAARTKMKQVTSGFIHIDGTPQLIEKDQAESDRMQLFKEAIEDIDGQMIIWAMFTEEINQLMVALKAAGITCAHYYGGTSDAEREKAIDGFADGSIRALVAHGQAAGVGLTLIGDQTTQARDLTTIYYSCSFDNEIRMQTEDRAHRIGQTKSAVYIDLIAEDTIDEETLRNLAHKSATAAAVIDGKVSPC
jgi:SNF2 family DNA or RNA helicase